MELIKIYRSLGVMERTVIDFAKEALLTTDLQKFLKENAGFWKPLKAQIPTSSGRSRETLAIILAGIIPRCKMCETTVTWNHSKQTFRLYCSSSCANKDDDKKKKTAESNIIKYGTPHPMQNSKVLTKQLKTMNDLYGVDRPMQHSEMKETIKRTNLDKYGGVAPACNDSILKKTCQTNLDKYGVKYVSQDSGIRQKQIDTLFQSHGVVVPMFNESIRNKVSEIVHSNARKTCYSSQQHISTEALQVLSSAEILHTKHIIEKQSLTDIARDIDVNPETVRKRLHLHNIPVNRYNVSSGEKSVNNFIQSLGIETQTNNRQLIPPYEVDIFIPSKNIAIEYCGLYWHSEQAGKDKQYHAKKHDLCAAKEIQLITIFEDEWFKRKSQVRSKLISLMGMDSTTSIYARKTHITKVSKPEKQTFYDLHHIQGGCGSSVDLGLTYYGILVACMSFINRGDGEYELIRFATNGRVVGGFSKLFKHFTTHNNFTRVVSFADLRWSTGNLYHVNGWKVDTIIPPDYQYSPDAKTRHHKFNYRRKNLPKLLKTFDPTLSERENCDNNNILRIWDCGKIRFVFDKVQ